jgi:F-type H+-transporting ATPase subunit alpha
VLRQPQYEPLTVAEQLGVLLAATEGVFDELDVEAIAGAEARVRAAVRHDLPALSEALDGGEPLDDHARNRIVETARTAVRAER